MDIEKAGRIISIFAVVIPILAGGITYAIDLNNTRKSNNFKNFHDLIAEIYDGGRKEYAGSQRALIYELSNFHDYNEFICRELPVMKIKFNNKDTHAEIDAVYEKIKCK